MNNIYLLYAYKRHSETGNNRLVMATADYETLLSKIGEIVLNRNMEYRDLYGQKGLTQFNKDCKNGSVNFDNLSYGLVEKIENIQAADFIKGANPINDVVTAFVTHQKGAGRYNDYVSNILLENIDKISIDLIGKELFGSYAEDNLTSACRMLLQEHNIEHTYQGYGKYSLPLSLEEALDRFDNNKEVHLIYPDDTEAVPQKRSDILEYGTFFSYEISQELVKENIDEGLKQPGEIEINLKHQEFIRRIEKDGFRFIKCEEYDPDIQRDYYGPDRIYKDDAEILIINEDGEMLYQPEKRGEAYQIFHIRNDVNEYVSAYESAKAADAKSNIGYYMAMDWGKCVLGIRQSQYMEYQFVTWQKDGFGEGYNHGHYYSDFQKAKEDFAIRSGLVNEDRMFTETELRTCGQ